MTIDLSAPALVQRNDHGPLALARGASAHEEPGAADATPTFAALLTALDTDAGADPATAIVLCADALPVPAAGLAQVELEPVPDPAMLLAQGLSRTPLAMQDPAGGALPPMGSGPAGAGAMVLALPGSDLPAQTSPPQAPARAATPGFGVPVPVFGAAGGVAGGTGSAVVAAVAPSLPTAPATATAAASDAPQDTPISGSAPAGVRLDGAVALPAGDAIEVPRLPQRRTPGADGGRVARGDDTVAGSGEAARSDWRAMLTAQGERVVASAASASEAAAGGFRPLPGLRTTERSAGRSGLLALDAGQPGAGAQAGYAPSTAPNAAGAALPDAVPAAGPSAELAQKVHYWITRGTQNAELQLDAFGGKAVDVSISVQGNEALVEFRTDQADARRVLQEAMPQLREMLKSEGLVLAGGFVGTSAQQDPQAQSRRAGAATVGRTASVAAPSATTPEEVSRRAHGPGRAVDVFV